MKVIRSMYDFKSYRVFNKQSAAKAFIYAVLISLILGLVMYASPTMAIMAVTNALSKDIENKVPQFEIKNNQLLLKGDNKVEIKNKKSILVFDSVDDIKKVAENQDSGVFMGKESFIIRAEGKEYVNENYASWDITMNRDDFTSFLEISKPMPYIYLGAMLIFTIIATFFKVLIIAIISKLVLSKSFGTCYKLGIYAITLPLVLLAIMNALNMEFPGSSIALLILGAVYVCLGAGELK